MSLVSEEFERKYQKYKITTVPESVYYIPYYLTKDEEEQLLDKVYSAPKPKWKSLSNRRLQNWGGLPHPKGMIPEALPPWLQVQADRLQSEGLFSTSAARINHVLVNEYLPGQGIIPHVDGPLFTPLIATLNLGGGCLIDFMTRNESDETLIDQFSLYLEEGSLLVQSGVVYEQHLHGIQEVDEDCIHGDVANLQHCTWLQVGDKVRRAKRVSLTIRNVPKVTKFKIKL